MGVPFAITGAHIKAEGSDARANQLDVLFHGYPPCEQEIASQPELAILPRAMFITVWIFA